MTYKYKEALDLLWETYYMNCTRIDRPDAFREALKAVNECVEKQMPKKPKETPFDLDRCPACNSSSVRGVYGSRKDYCSECGQRIDWGEVE